MTADLLPEDAIAARRQRRALAEALAEPDPAREAAERADTAARHDDAIAARHADVLFRVAKGQNYATIADHYSVTVRTVTTWVRDAKRAQLGTFRRVTTDDLLAETDAIHRNMRADLLNRMEGAAAAQDPKLWLELFKQLRCVELDRYAVREKVGFFQDYRPPRPDDDTDRPTMTVADRITQHARMAQMAKSLVASLRQHDPGPDTDAAPDNPTS